MEAADGRRSAIARDRSMSELPNPVRTSRHPVFSRFRTPRLNHQAGGSVS